MLRKETFWQRAKKMLGCFGSKETFGLEQKKMLGCFVPCARRAWWQWQSETIVIPLADLAQWQLKFGTFQTQTSNAGGVSVSIADLGPCGWGKLECHFVVDSSTPEAVGPQTRDEHGPLNRTTWALFANHAMVYKSIRHNGNVTTELSWYGHGGYDPNKPSISARERAHIQYDPEFPDITLL